MKLKKIPNKLLLELKEFGVSLWPKDRLLIKGKNGAGKSTLLKKCFKEKDKIVLLDQKQSFLKDEKTILENVVSYTKLKELDARQLLAKFLFRRDEVLRSVYTLSGGERLRVALCCIFGKKDLELLLLDEPTNNLDLESIEVIEEIINEFNGGIIIVSHDDEFIKNIKINKTINLSNNFKESFKF